MEDIQETKQFNKNGEEVDIRSKVNRIITLLIQRGEHLHYSTLETIKDLVTQEDA